MDKANEVPLDNCTQLETNITIHSLDDCYYCEKAKDLLDGINNIKEQYGDYFTNNYLFIGLVAVVIICVIVGWFLYRIITTKLFLNLKEVSEDTKVPIIGTEKKIMTPHGTEIKYTINPGTTHGKLLRVSGKGIPDVHYPGHNGDLIIRVNVSIPTKVSSEEKELLQHLRKSPNFS